MKTKRLSKKFEEGFKLAELCVVIACTGILAMLVLPALATGKIESAATGCLYNLRHLQTGCAMYSTENNDYLMPNSPYGYPNNECWCPNQDTPGAAMNWVYDHGNTNVAVFTNTLLWPYVSKNISVYRCPGDTVPSQNGFRVRSYSMNGQMGNVYCRSGTLNENPGYLTYSKGSDIISPTPANAFVFVDEAPNSLLNPNVFDGYLEISSSPESAMFPDVPACYLEGGCGFSFADGHAEVHKWITSVLKLPVAPNTPFIPGTSYDIPAGPANADWIWFTQHAASHQ